MQVLKTVLSVSIGFWVVLGIFVFSQVKKTYARNGTFSNNLLFLWFVMWGMYHLAVVLSALLHVWRIPVDRDFSLMLGWSLIGIGVAILAAGMIEFRSLRRSCGQDTSKLITTGIYRWSRNPQFIGCFLYLLGIAFVGRSGLAFTLVAAAAVVIRWYTVKLAEPYLERLYGEEYRLYRLKTGRWFSLPGRRKT